MNNPSTPQPWIAVVLSLCCPGLGHIYCGKLPRGLVLFLVSLLVLPVAALVAGLISSTVALVGLIVSFVVLLALWLFAIVDAWRMAARSQPAPRLDFQKPLVYGLFVAAGVISPMLSAVYVRQNLLEAFYIPSASMAPYLQNGDRILVNKARWRTRQLKRFDVVVFRAPDHPDRTYVKRLIGLPGDQVLVEGQAVTVNGQPVEDMQTTPARRQPDEHNRKDSGGGPEMGVVVPPGMSYVLGDNRDNSNDSRNFGPVALGNILGIAEYVYIPGDNWSRFGRLP
ncbi:MAG: signal peptidase I [Planctomycetia bacterium]|nr:signal peptidase I [Planctomycetia bacterium]